MRLLLLAVASLAGSGGLTVGLSTSRPAVRPVAVKLRFGSELHCGTAVGPPLTVTFPATERLPRRIAPSAVVVNRSSPASVTVSGHAVTIKVARPQVLCDVIGPGTISIGFTRAASLGNPAAAGTYRVSVRRGTQYVSGAFTIRK